MDIFYVISATADNDAVSKPAFALYAVRVASNFSFAGCLFSLQVLKRGVAMWFKKFQLVIPSVP